MFKPSLYLIVTDSHISSVLHRLVSLLSEHAKMQASEEASIKQAQSATAAAQRLLDQSKVTDSDTEDIYVSLLLSSSKCYMSWVV